ncbi:hypothetical protein [Actinoplanes sp. GCM10030250]|uniref:hypothetical protein n=1 Tax=Actinoplanes sp. GCM10030250 TaxID=3273376 RepID=UPI00360EF305
MPKNESGDVTARLDEHQRTERLLRYYQRASIFLVVTGMIKGLIGIAMQPAEEIIWWANLGQLLLCALAALWIAAPYRRRIRKALTRIFEILPEKP